MFKQNFFNKNIIYYFFNKIIYFLIKYLILELDRFVFFNHFSFDY